MPLLTQAFEKFPHHLSHELTKIYNYDAGKSPEQVLALIQQKMQRPNARLYIAHFSGRWLAAAVVTGTLESRQIHHLCVHNTARLRGIGRKLLNEIRRIESAHGNQRLITCISPANQAAQSFLEALDGKVDEKDRDHVAIDLVQRAYQEQTALCFDLMA